MDETVRYLINLALAGGVWFVLYIAVGTASTIFTCFMAVVTVRAGLWLWGRLPLLEAQNYRQKKIEQGAWKDDEGETRLVKLAARQRRKWTAMLNGVLGELAVLLAFTILIALGQPVSWFVLAIGSVVVILSTVAVWI